MAQKMSIVNEHAQNYIRAVMADRLRSEGFVSRGGKDFHWYRLVNNDVVQAVYFHTQWAKLPLFMAIGYGCHPLFIAPEYCSGIRMAGVARSHEAVDPGRFIIKQGITNAPYSLSAMVTCPTDPAHGADILDDILSRIPHAPSIEDCYALHKQRLIDSAKELEVEPEKLYSNLSTDFMDEVIYMDDRQMYPYCEATLRHKFECFERGQAVRTLHPTEIAELNACKDIEQAILHGQRDHHLELLRQRAADNLATLKKKVKLPD